MPISTALRVSTTLLIASLAFASLSLADAPAYYFEDFTTTATLDTASSTALWDSLGGVISLHDLSPQVIGSHATPAIANDIVLEGDYAYVAMFGSGVRVLDVSIPGSPAAVSTYDTQGDANAVAIDGDYLYVADGFDGLKIIDVSIPLTPVLLGSHPIGGIAQGLEVAGNLVFVASTDSGLTIVDVTNPATPIRRGQVDTPGTGYSVVVDGDLAYFADGSAGFHVIGVGDSAIAPSILTSYNMPGFVLGLAIDGDLLYIANEFDGVRIFDVTDPVNPVELGRFDTAGPLAGIAVDGDYAYCAELGGGLHVLNVIDPSNPDEIALVSPGSEALDVALHPEYAFVASGSQGIQVVRVAQRVPEPAVVLQLNTAGGPNEIKIAGDFAFSAGFCGGKFQVLDISAPYAMNQVAVESGVNCPRGIEMHGNRVFVANHDDGFGVVDVTTPALPATIGLVSTGGRAIGTHVIGNRLYVMFNSGVQVYAIENADAPALLATYPSAVQYYRADHAGDFLFVAGGADGLVILDVSDPDTLISVASISTGSEFRDVRVEGDHAYVADHGYGVRVYDISDPTSPVFVGQTAVRSESNPERLHVEGNSLFLVGDVPGGGGSGTDFIDVSDPANPLLLIRVPSQDDALGVDAAGDLLFVADDLDGIQILRYLDRRYRSQDDVIRSKRIIDTPESLAAVELLTSQEDSIRWRVSLDDGVVWTDVLPGAGPLLLAERGGQVRWEATLEDIGIPEGPTATNLALQFWWEGPRICRVDDMPGDEGGRVEIEFLASAHDLPGVSPTPAIGYNVWRRIAATFKALETNGRRIDFLPGEGLDSFEKDGEVVVVSSSAGAGLPAGAWMVLGQLPASAESTYSFETRTAGDAASGVGPSVFLVTVHTTDIDQFFSSNVDSGISTDDVAPLAPSNFIGSFGPNAQYLSWDPAPEVDFQYFRVYRDTVPGFVPSGANLVHQTIATTWGDSTVVGGVYYKLTTLDAAGNESAPATLNDVTETAGGTVPARYALHFNDPNPFNPSTNIRFDVPAPGGLVRLSIYDIKGRRVRQLVDRHLDAGRHRVVWDGTSDRGGRAPSGVYFSRLEAYDYRASRKMVLVE